MNKQSFKVSLPAAALFLLAASACLAQAQPAPGGAGCGVVVTMETRERSTTRYAFLPPSPTGQPAAGALTLVLLTGGSGHVDLDAKGCPRALKGNSLVRSISLFAAAGFGTALVDAPSDFHGEDGLGGFRIAPQHADDLGKVIADLRARTGRAVWVLGTSRGSISAANVGARHSGPSAPDGLVLTSALMSGQRDAKKAWVAQSVFDLALEDIRAPLLLVGHAADKCLRSPPELMGRVMARVRSPRQQAVTVTGGADPAGQSSLAACEGRSPHGFVDQEAEVADGIARFVRGGKY